MKIIIEGVDKIGKTTQVDLLVKKLDAVKVKFPNESSHSGRTLRKILDKELPYEPNSFQALMVLDKLGATPFIKNLDDANEYVIFDRWYQSGEVYGFLEGVDEEWMHEMNEMLVPIDLVIILHGTPYATDDDIYGDEDFQEKVNNKYVELANKYGWFLVNGNQSIEDVNKEIMEIIHYELLSPKDKIMNTIQECYSIHTADHNMNPSAMFVSSEYNNILGTDKYAFLVPIIQTFCKKNTIMAVGGDNDRALHETIIYLEE